MDEFEGVEDVIAAVEQAGFSASASQLRRWHRAGLLEAPRQRSLGRGRGTRTEFAAGTSELAIEICRRSLKRTSLVDIGWALWWEGRPIRIDFIRTALSHELEKFRAEIESIVSNGVLTEKAESALDKSTSGRLPSRSLRWARRRFGADTFDEFLQSLLMVAAGEVESLDDSQIADLERGLGLDRGRTDLLPSGEPWLTGSPREDFTNIAALFQRVRNGEGLDVDDDELRVARDEVQRFIAMFAGLVRIMQMGFGRWGFGFGAVGAALDDFMDNPAGQRGIFLIWMAIRSTDLRPNIDLLLAKASDIERASAQLAMLQELRSVVPALGQSVSERDLVRAGFSERRQSAVNAAILEVRNEHAEEIDRFFAEHVGPALEGETPKAPAT